MASGDLVVTLGEEEREMALEALSGSFSSFVTTTPTPTPEESIQGDACIKFQQRVSDAKARKQNTGPWSWCQDFVTRLKHERVLRSRRCIRDTHWNSDSLDDMIPKDMDERIKGARFETHMITMPDGVQIAADVMLPSPSHSAIGEGGKLSCIFHQTRYYRQWRLRRVFKSVESFPMDPINIHFKKGFLAAGFAIVSIDVRGTGASFGQWTAPCSDKENEDSKVVLDWITQQPWYDGNVFLYGISYDAMASLFTTSWKHKSVRACSPLYLYWDVFNDMGCPGGVIVHYFFDNWNGLVHALDSSKLLQAPSPMGRMFVTGFKGVKGKSKELVKQAIADHDTVDISQALRQVDFKDDKPKALLGRKIDDCSPYVKYKGIKASGVPMFIVAGWLDGSARSSINLFCHAAKSSGSRLLIGPWTHGGVQHAGLGPKQKTTYSSFHKIMRSGRSRLVGEVVKFFAECREEGANSDRSGSSRHVGKESITYYTMNSPFGVGSWKHTNSWPPKQLTLECLYLNMRQKGEAKISLTPPSCDSDLQFEAKSSHAPRGHSRYHTMIFIADKLNYFRAKNSGHVFMDSRPLDCHLEVTGTPYIELWLSSSDNDADIIVYLEDYDPVSGHVSYVTEGVFRASHRKIQRSEACRSHLQATIPPGIPFWHSFNKADAEPLVPNKPTQVMFELMPTSYCFQRDSCIRLSFSGSDEAHYLHKMKEQRNITLYSGPKMMSRLFLPQKVINLE